MIGYPVLKQPDREQMLHDLKLSAEELSVFDGIDWTSCPKHIAFIMDGNGRWAKAQGRPRSFGHSAGVRTVHEMVETCGKIPVDFVTFYAFSTENWKRSESEVKTLMSLFSSSLRKYLDELHRQGVRIDWIGDIDGMGEAIAKDFYVAREKTRSNTRIHMNLALNYSGRQDILLAAQRLIQTYSKGEDLKQLTAEEFHSYMSTAHLPDPELLIRTSGEMRLSNFLLWECAYTEFFYTSVHWPDFQRIHLLQAILDYQSRSRRFGGA